MPNDFRENWPEMRIKHLELLQQTISRMAKNSATLKNYCTAITAALLSFGAALDEADILLFSSPLVIIFSLMDSNYLGSGPIKSLALVACG